MVRDSGKVMQFWSKIYCHNPGCRCISHMWVNIIAIYSVYKVASSTSFKIYKSVYLPMILLPLYRSSSQLSISLFPYFFLLNGQVCGKCINSILRIKQYPWMRDYAEIMVSYVQWQVHSSLNVQVQGLMTSCHI